MRHIVASATRLACRRRDRRAVIPAAPRSQHVHAEPVACPQDRRCVSPARLTLLSSVFIVAVRGLVYELAVGALASYLLGDSVLQFSTVIGARHRRRRRNL